MASLFGDVAICQANGLRFMMYPTWYSVLRASVEVLVQSNIAWRVSFVCFAPFETISLLFLSMTPNRHRLSCGKLDKCGDFLGLPRSGDARLHSWDERFKLFSFMIDDVFGHGQYVQHAFGGELESWNAFKENNPSWDRIRGIMIDKGFGKSKFPLSRILIWHFHVKKYLRTEMAKALYGGRDAVNVDRVKDAVNVMVKPQDENDYDKGLRYMYYFRDGYDDQYQLPKAKRPNLVFLINSWDSCKTKWAVYERGHIPHLGNHTNNRSRSTTRT
ncbi:hypothetical protein PHMEG_0009009 [Phytophthora megakarya]|uniref:ZSWIM1/3 RNaseH-like domain-containing protein n=1 Tax=Phytophthora megakarya TaxID=4795 RepID=A0A225WJR0_9STRA|nr:hypothetical protein PHMEG_0009009 [Phytophthora megakarya]